MASVKRVICRSCSIVISLVVLVGGVIGWSVYERAQDARQASEAFQEEPAPPLPRGPQNESGLSRITKSLHDQREEMGLKWAKNGDKAAADGLTDTALVAYKTSLAYLEDSGGCQGTMANAVREKIASIQKKPYDVPCTAGPR
jgi:hypothetical protein